MKKNYALIVVFILLLPVYVLAGEYDLVKGKGIEVCEACQKNLNSFNLHNEYVMACGRKLNPQFTDFQKPEWRKIDLRKHVELLKKIELFLGNYVVTSNNVKGWEEYIESRIKGEYISIDLCQIDINNDGVKENVIKYSDGSCPGANYYGAALLVLNNQCTEIDIEKTRPLFQNPRSLKNGPLSEGWDGTMYDIFIYKDKTYFDRWRYSDLSSDSKAIIRTDKLLKVFLTEPDKEGDSITREICLYKFTTMK